MITAIISKAFVYNGEVWLIGWFICALLYFAILISFRRNRTKNGFKNMVFCFLATEFLVIWRGHCSIMTGQDTLIVV